MTTTPSAPDARSADTAWAREQLGVPDASEGAAVRGALLRQLRAHEFLPPSDWQACAIAAMGRVSEGLTPSDAIAAGRRDALREQVETFADSFFTLEPATRRAQWSELSTLCARHAPLAARLEALSPGLDLCVAPLPADARSETAELQSEFLRLFAERPAARAAMLLELRPRWAEDRRRWEDAARQLEVYCPEIAGLNVALIRELKWWRAAEFEQDRILRKQRRALKKQAATGDRSGYWIVFLLTCFGAGVGIASLEQSDKKHQQPANYSGYSSPTSNLDKLVRETYQKIEEQKRRAASKQGGVGDATQDNPQGADDPQLYLGDALRRLYNLPPNEPKKEPAARAPQ